MIFSFEVTNYVIINYRLQEGVPQTIEAMREAGIKVSPFSFSYKNLLMYNPPPLPAQNC